MKKILGWIVVVTVPLVLVSSCLLYVAVSRHQEMIVERASISLEDFEWLVDRRPILASEADRAMDAEVDDLASRPPERLKEMISPEEVAQQWLAEDGVEWRMSSRMAVVGEVVESALLAVGLEPTASRWALVNGVLRMQTGELDAARRYLYEALEAPPAPFFIREASGRLAWLVEDPEEAARLLELSTGDDVWLSNIVDAVREARNDDGGYAFDDWMVRTARAVATVVVSAAERETVARTRALYLDTSLENAVVLTRVTGSYVLADYYLARLRERNPEAARRFDEEHLFRADSDLERKSSAPAHAKG